MCDFDKLEVVELITVRSYLRLLKLFSVHKIFKEIVKV